jgi:hypothetical protein
MDIIAIGIDVSKDRLDFAVHPGGKTFVVERNGAGLERLAGQLMLLAPAIVALEATGGFETIVAAALDKKPRLKFPIAKKPRFLPRTPGASCCVIGVRQAIDSPNRLLHLQKPRLTGCRLHITISVASSATEEAIMNDLSAWLASQHHGLRTFRSFRQKLQEISSGDPRQRAICRLLNAIVDGYIDAYDEAPLPVAIADRAPSTLARLGGGHRFQCWSGAPARRHHRVAAFDLRQ